MELLERESQLGRLCRALDEAAAGHGRVVFVGGEAGIGKTALVDRFVGGLNGDARVAVGRCDALATPRALGPFVDVAGTLGIEAIGDRDRLLAALFANLRTGRPSVVVIEDAHWADEGTVDLLAMLGRRAADLPLLLVVTYRDEDVGAGHPLRDALGHLATASRAMWMQLEPLSLDAVAQLAAPVGASADEVFRLTGGNPFYVTETLAAPPGTVATNLRMAVLARASRLCSPGARSVLDAASVVPGRVEGWLLAALCGGALDGADECQAVGMLSVDGDDYVFRHELARQVIEHELAPVARRELHARAATALAKHARSDPARVAYHAELGGDADRLASAATRACDLAIERAAFDAAVRHGEQALGVADRLSAPAAAELRLVYATALAQLGRTDEAITHASESLAHSHRSGDATGEARVLTRLATMYSNQGRMADATRSIRRAVELLEPGEAGTDLVRAYIATCGVHMLARERDEAVVWGTKAVVIATELGDDALRANALVQLGIADVMDNRFDGLERIRHGIDIAARVRAHPIVALGYSQIGSGCAELRRYDLAVPALVEGAAYATDHGIEAQRCYLVAWLARCRFDLGQWDEAERLAGDVLANARGVGIARFVALNTLGWLRARRGDDDVWPLLDEALEFARRTGHLQRLWPCAVARAEAGWLEGELVPHVGLIEEQFDLASRRRHHVAVGELGTWLCRAGRPVDELGAEPFASWNRGDHAAAAAGFRSMECPYEAASALASTGDTASLREAHATFQRLGAVPAAERVVTELRQRGVRVAAARPSASPPVHPGGLSDREVEVIRLVCAGFTNPQIAAALYISRKTAEHHVSNILTKFGAATRTEAATAAVRLGLVEG